MPLVPLAQCGLSDVTTPTTKVSSSKLIIMPMIVGGITVGSCTTYPWMVRLNVDGGDVCGGFIIDATHILTAAHCAVYVNLG